MPTLNEIYNLRGLKASDRTNEEQQAINQQMGYKPKPQAVPKIKNVNSNKIVAHPTLPQNIDTVDMYADPTTYQKIKGKNLEKGLAKTFNLPEDFIEQNEANYRKALAEFNEHYGVNRNTVNSSASEYIDKIANDVSSYYKRYKGTDKLPNDPQLNKSLAAGYNAKLEVYGKQQADQWLDNQYKNIVGKNQSWWEQALNGFGHLGPAIEGGAIQLAGNIYGTINPLLKLFDNDLALPDNKDLNWWNNYWNNILDNPITRYGRDVEHAGASNVLQGLTNLLGINDESASDRIAATKASATYLNPEGLGADNIATTAEQDDSYINSATPWLAVQSGGFTTLSMLVGGALAKGSSLLFNGLAKGANWLNKTNKIIKTQKALEKTLEGLKEVQNFTDVTVVPGLVGGTEGMMEGLNTKIQVEQEAIQKLDDFYKDKVSKEAEDLYNANKDKMIEIRTDRGKRLVQAMSREQAFKTVWDKYQKEYIDSRRHIETAASRAGQCNMWANSLINGMLNTTLKAGLQHARVQETLRNNRLTGWAFQRPRFTIGNDGTITARASKLNKIKALIKEPIGEGLEEYLQSLSNDTMTGAAENNIDEFIKNKFDGDGTAKIGNQFSSDWSAALTALKGSIIDKNSIESAILGAMGSAMGSLSLPGRGYHRDENGNIVQNSVFSPKNLTRGLKADGTHESTMDAIMRLTPWRSGMLSNYRELKKEESDAQQAAKTMTEWAKDPTNLAKWDGLVGTANWLTQMQNAMESNDQFSYRKAQMGKAINDVMTLSKLKGTSLYDTVLKDLQRSSQMDVTSEEGQSMVQKMRAADSEGLQNKSDEDIIEKIKSNANKMLGIMSSIENEGDHLDGLFGRMDEDTKQSLIFGKIMEKDFTERRDELEQEIDEIKSRIKSSRSSSNTTLEDNLKSLILTYGSVNQAIREESKLADKQQKAEEKVQELEAIDKSKLSDKQKEELESKKAEAKSLAEECKKFDALYTKDDKGKSTGQVNSELLHMVLNEEEIMNLDPATRAMVLLQGANKLYNATHQNRQKIDEINQQIDEIQKKIDALNEQKNGWMTPDGKVKKGHNKQVQRNDKAISQLEKDKYSKMRELNAEQGDMNSKSIYSDAQQAVIDNLIQQGTDIDEDFLDKAVDLFRLDKGIKDYHSQYQAILSDPNAFYNYVQRTKRNAAIDLLKRRVERVADIEDYREYSRELNKLTANASQEDMMIIMNTLRNRSNKQKADATQQREQQRIDDIVNNNTEGQLNINEEGEVSVEEESPVETETNFDKYIQNQRQQESLLRQFEKNTSLTDNDMSLLLDAMQYLSSEGVEVTDREKAVETLLEKDEEGNLGGKFRQWVEERNSNITPQQQAFMPTFTSIGQVVNQYVELLNGDEADRINRTAANPTIIPLSQGNEEEEGRIDTNDTKPIVPSTPAPAPGSSPLASPAQEKPKPKSKGPSIWDIGGSTPESGHFVDGDGTVATDATTEAASRRQAEKAKEETPKTSLEEAFSKVTTPEIASNLNILDNIMDAMTFTEDGKNVKITDKEKEIAKQYLNDLAVNTDEAYSTMDELIDAILSQANKLQNQQDMMEDENNKEYEHAAGVLKTLARRLTVKNTRKRSTFSRPGRPVNTQASQIHTADIAYMESQNPDAWAVRFTNDHAIDEWVRENTIATDTPVYFLTNSEWTAEVTQQMSNPENSRKYDTLSDMPLVAAVEVESPKNIDTTTAIQIGDKWYQPIGVMPSTKSIVGGAERTFDIRKLASKEQGTHLVTSNGMPNGNPLVTHVAGKNYLKAHHPDASTQTNRNNSSENNSDIISDILDTLPLSSVQRLQGLSKQDMLKDPEYISARNKFVSRLSWGEGYAGNQDKLNNQVLYTPDDLKHNEGRTSDRSAQPMIVFTKPMSATTARESDRTLSDILNSGSNDEVVTFNSRTQRLFNEVIRPLFENLPTVDKHDDRSARVITQEDLENNPDAFKEEEDRLTSLFNGYNGTSNTHGINGLSNFIHIRRNSGWSIQVVAPSNLQKTSGLESSESIYKIMLINADSSMTPVEIGTITAKANVGQPNQENIEAAKSMLRNLLKECTDGVLQDISQWQVPARDIKGVNESDSRIASKARQNIEAIVDDEILELGGSSLVYNVDGITLNAPIAMDGRVVYPIDKVANPTNAQPATPINNTPQGQGSVTTKDNIQVDPNSGAALEKPTSKPKVEVKTEAEKRAETLTAKIVEDSKQFTLSEDESYYYITDKSTGQQVKYLRVTTVIGADENTAQWFPGEEELKNKLGLSDLPIVTRNTLLSIENKGKTGKLEDQKQYINEAINQLVSLTGKSTEEVRHAIAELRTEYKKNKYGAWGVPSTALGNTADTIVRDFLAGKLKESYPNITKEVLNHFVGQLTNFKHDLTSKGIKIVSEGVMAHGKITITDDNGNQHDINVAGTLDLFGYDDKGNFYIFDMKTTRDHSAQKLQREKAKWSRQISMYADLLKQSYPDIDIRAENLRIIPIDVDYPAPKGKGAGMSLMGPNYSVVPKGQPNEGQLQMTLKGNIVQDFIQDNVDDFKMRDVTLKGQFQPGYTPFHINWDNLSAEDQEIAEFLHEQASEVKEQDSTPDEAEILHRLKLDPYRHPRDKKDMFDEYDGEYTPAPQAPSILNEMDRGQFEWRVLSDEVKSYLKEEWEVETEMDYWEIRDDRPSWRAMLEDLRCHGLM